MANYNQADLNERLERWKEADNHGWALISKKVPAASKGNDVVVFAFSILAGLCGLGFGVALVLGSPPAVYGGLLGIGFIALAIAWRRFMADRFPQVRAAEIRTHKPHEPAVGLIAPIKRRNFLGLAFGGGAGLFGLGLLSLVPSIAPAPESTLYDRLFAPGQRLVDTDGNPVKLSALKRGGNMTVWPEGRVYFERSATLLVHSWNPVESAPSMDGVLDGHIIAYSRICTHLGCPVACHRDRSDDIFCPCHQSTFKITNGGKVIWGPAGRSLPQLPLTVDEEGYIVAKADYIGQVGPSVGDFGKTDKKKSLLEGDN